MPLLRQNIGAEPVSINQVNCSDCKKGLDVISKKAASQGKQAWLKSVKADTKRLRKDDVELACHCTGGTQAWP